MKFIDARILLKTAADNGIIRYGNNNTEIVVKNKKGWNIEPIDEVAKALMNDDNAQQMLITALTQRGITIPWFETTISALIEKNHKREAV